VQFLNVLLYILLAISSFFLICLVLIQRGKGGGLAGALGGAGGSSAFGTKAGDVFTRVTMISAGVWIALNMFLVVLSNRRTSAWSTDTPVSKSSFEPNKNKGGTGSGSGTGTDKAGLPDAGLDKGPGIPAPKARTGAPAVEVSGGSPSAPVPIAPLPAPTTKP